MDRVAGHGEISDADPHLIILPHDKMVDAGKDTRLLKVHMLKSVISAALGV